MYLASILYYLSWPVLILISYYAVLFALEKYGNKIEKEE